MKFANASFSFLILLILFSGCLVNSSEDDTVMIRIKNSSSYSMQNILVKFPDEEITYGDLSSGEESGFEVVTKAYRYAYIETIVDNKTVILQPTDYVGESLLEPGQYTYNLSIDQETFNSDNFSNALKLEFIEE